MKKITTLILTLFIGFSALGQQTYFTTPPSGSTSLTGLQYRYKAITPDSLNQLFMFWNGKYNQVYTATEANLRFAPSTSGQIIGRTISSIPTIGQVITTGTPDQVFVQLYGQTQVPTASLSGGTTYELGITAAIHNLSFSYGRQMATATISTAAITPGPLNVYSTQPAQPGTVSGTQSVTTPSNTNRTYTLTVTTTDAKQATSTTTDTWLPGRYYGRSASATPDNTIILAVAGGSKELSSSVSGTFTITASGSSYPFFAYPSSEAALTSIKDVNGFEVISAFNVTTVSVTNVNSYVQNYRVYTLNSTTASNYQITTL